MGEGCCPKIMHKANTSFPTCLGSPVVCWPWTYYVARNKIELWIPQILPPRAEKGIQKPCLACLQDGLLLMHLAAFVPWALYWLHKPSQHRPGRYLHFPGTLTMGNWNGFPCNRPSPGFRKSVGTGPSRSLWKLFTCLRGVCWIVHLEPPMSPNPCQAVVVPAFNPSF